MYLLLDRFALEVLQKLNESSTYTDHRKLTLADQKKLHDISYQNMNVLTDIFITFPLLLLLKHNTKWNHSNP